jgi:predicted N-acyltransferase
MKTVRRLERVQRLPHLCLLGLFAALEQAVEGDGLSSAHALFPNARQASRMDTEGYRGASVRCAVTLSSASS